MVVLYYPIASHSVSCHSIPIRCFLSILFYPTPIITILSNDIRSDSILFTRVNNLKSSTAFIIPPNIPDCTRLLAYDLLLSVGLAMGNKIGSRQKSDGGSKKSEVKRRPKKNGSASLTSNSATREKKVISCPDLSGAVPYKFDDTNVDVTIYRSYSNVAEPGSDKKRASVLAEPDPDIRVYRRSTGSLARQKGDASDKSQTLPRSFGRGTRHSMPPGTPTTQSNGTVRRETISGGVQRSSTIGGYSGGGLGDAKGSKRTLSTASMASIGYKGKLN